MAARRAPEIHKLLLETISVVNISYILSSVWAGSLLNCANRKQIPILALTFPW